MTSQRISAGVKRKTARLPAGDPAKRVSQKRSGTVRSSTSSETASFSPTACEPAPSESSKQRMTASSDEGSSRRERTQEQDAAETSEVELQSAVERQQSEVDWSGSTSEIRENAEALEMQLSTEGEQLTGRINSDIIENHERAREVSVAPEVQSAESTSKLTVCQCYGHRWKNYCSLRA